jgi:hypothetical protein
MGELGPGAGNAPYCRKLFHGRWESQPWAGKNMDKLFSFIILQLHSKAGTGSGLLLFKLSHVAFKDLVIPGSDGKLDAELAPWTHDPPPVLFFCSVES